MLPFTLLPLTLLPFTPAPLTSLLFALRLIGLTLLANWGRAPTSVLDRVAPGQSAPAGGDLLDQLKRIDQQPPAAPAAPEPPRPGQ